MQILHPTWVTSLCSPSFVSDTLLCWQILDRVADGIVFGALLPCEECSGQLVFKSDAYYCTGDITAWTKCMVRTQTPNRKEWVIPKVSGGSWDPQTETRGPLPPSCHAGSAAFFRLTAGPSSSLEYKVTLLAPWFKKFTCRTRALRAGVQVCPVRERPSCWQSVGHSCSCSASAYSVPGTALSSGDRW